MKYRRFIIENYRGISKPVEIDLEKDSIVPIIGINEAGKTTILEAIFSFDYTNDNLINGKHLSDIANFYNPYSNEPAKVSAIIEVSQNVIGDIINDLLIRNETNNEYVNPLASSFEADILGLEKFAVSTIPLAVTVTRNISELKYSCDMPLPNELSEYVAKEIVRNAPYILYFDDFRDSIEQYINVPSDQAEENQSSWIPYIQELLKRVDNNISIYNFHDKHANQRDTIIRSAQKILQEALTKNWNTFNVDDGRQLDIEIKYHNKNEIEFRIVEKIETSNGDIEERFFSIKDRSKGFFWYFNFIMKLEYNPKKRTQQDTDTIYLLDEPGSFLHSTAQSKLCELLRKLSLKNKVLYCTHSPYLLDPEFIPINTIKVSQKGSDGVVRLKAIHDTVLNRNNAAFEPVLDALEVKPMILSYDVDNIVLVEGIYDYYVFEMFKPVQSNFNFFPTTGADSIRYHISYMIFLGKKYAVIWDNDSKGREVFKRASKEFGDSEAVKWILLPKDEATKNSRLETLFEEVDITLLKSKLELPQNTTFEKVIVSLFHFDNQKELLTHISQASKDRINKVFEEVAQKLSL